MVNLKEHGTKEVAVQIFPGKKMKGMKNWKSRKKSIQRRTLSLENKAWECQGVWTPPQHRDKEKEKGPVRKRMGHMNTEIIRKPGERALVIKDLIKGTRQVHSW